ncbi:MULTISPECIES: ABC transporter substrate-binding protein [unclassified Micromonospora]|uniref:ABC transporter substrate-binding protein n=1 Tax=unclassified Micromonospora TaxID=2617518 RepID=UPI001033B566|nr:MULTISPECIES: sugar ABC transporter substrate-binding protein [unclassified Micromonospora]QKW15051.1 sugar ABC transporter substrate-binding protein [Verrucosispora sp. NA02020]TBL37259.1 sugar ABC transporter substrate-binding protein [Verrucosispora sp. SN26_14.1]
MRSGKGIRVVATALTGVLAMSACGGGETQDSGPATLRVTVWSANEAHLALFNEIADEYRQNNPDVTQITFDPLPFDTYTTALTTQIAGGNAPDLAWVFENSAPDFVASGALLPLDETLKKTDGYQYDDILPATLKLWQDDGKLYAYPFSTSPFGVFVNTDLLKQADQRTPAELIEAGQWTWDNAFGAAGATQAATGKAGLVIRDFDYKDWSNLSTIWTGWGARAWSEDGRTCGFAEPEMVEAMTRLHRAVFTDKALPGPGTTADFFAGDAAMTITQISRASLLEDDGFAWDLVPLPAGPKGPYAVVGQAGIGVLKRSPNAEAAADFLAFLTNPTNSAKLAQFFPPPRQSQLTADTLAKTNPKLEPEQLQKVVIDGITNGVVKPSHAGQAEISQQVRAGLDPLWKADADVRAVLDGVCGKIQPLLAK